MTDDRDDNKLIAERRKKLETLREQGNAYPNDVHRNALADELHQAYGGHEAEHLVEEVVEVAVAGRLMRKTESYPIANCKPKLIEACVRGADCRF